MVRWDNIILKSYTQFSKRDQIRVDKVNRFCRYEKSKSCIRKLIPGEE